MKTSIDKANIWVEIEKTIFHIQKIEKLRKNLVEEMTVGQIYLPKEEYEEAETYFIELVNIFGRKIEHMFKYLHKVLGEYLAEKKDRTDKRTGIEVC